MNYQDFPIVKLKAAVEQEEWFKLAKGRLLPSANPQDFQMNGNRPTWAELYVEYKGFECYIQINMMGRKCMLTNTFHISCTKPNFCHESRKKTAKTVDGAITKLCDTFWTAAQKMDSEEHRIRAEQEEKRIREEQQANIISKAGYPVVAHKYSPQCLTFNMSRNYHIAFNYYGKPGKEKFSIQNITGDFTMAQIETFLHCLNVCPAAAADRILNGK